MFSTYVKDTLQWNYLPSNDIKHVCIGLSLNLVINLKSKSVQPHVNLAASPGCLLDRGWHCDMLCEWVKTKIVVISNIRFKLCFGTWLRLIHQKTWTSKWLDFIIFDLYTFPTLSPKNIFSAHFKRNWNMVWTTKQIHRIRIIIIILTQWG